MTMLKRMRKMIKMMTTTMTTAVVKIANAKREEILMVQEEVALNNHKWVSTIFIVRILI